MEYISLDLTDEKIYTMKILDEREDEDEEKRQRPKTSHSLFAKDFPKSKKRIRPCKEENNT